MGLFQQSVLNKYLKEANQDDIESAYAKLKDYFHNPEIQQNIRGSNEEQFQEGFLRELFVSVFGYTINPNPNYNLTTEYKNERGAKKADGAVLNEGVAIGVIELKSTKTKELEAIRLQAFDYKANQSKCVYVITSNFEKLRFYIHNAVDFEEFDLFRLTYEHFQLMWLCLGKENLLKGIPLQMKEASILKEETITKKIYVDYSRFKKDLYNDLVANNINLELFKDKKEKEIKLLLFKKSQKLLDRFLFILFSEDRGLLPPNSVSEIIKQWENQTDWGDNVTLYGRYKKYFHLLNTGWKGKKHEIFAYNGGLFAPDEILDNIAISDDILKKHTEVLTGYDFETEVDVNILGHIFENSLNEIEEITSQIEGEEVDLKKSKRKKDGVFYTPKYITKYIVESTVGKLCDEKKFELGINESEYLKVRKGRTARKLKELAGLLDEYREWLLLLTICDPACGSGAFLNQSLDFLIREHRYIDELRAKLLDVPMVFTEVENSILENNLFGVDINEESIEIAKLSLWLRTAQKGRKLTTLSSNIKCGNSLIDDPEVAGEKAFNWQKEFSDIFRKKQKRIWHITTATHNSRYSQRMFDNHVPSGKPVWLSEKEELVVMETIVGIVKKDKLNILSANICGDHMHLLLVCTENELPQIVQKIKSMSARDCNTAMGLTIPGEHAAGTTEHAPSPILHPTEATEHAPLLGHALLPEHAPLPAHKRGKTQFHLWTKKFGKKPVDSTEQLENTLQYIKDNRIKHKLPQSKELQKLIDSFTCSREHAFRPEYTGGFDVVIGNPPYVRQELIYKNEKPFFEKTYPLVFRNTADLYVYFYNHSVNLLKSSGFLGFITPNKFIRSSYGTGLRQFLSRFQIQQIIDFGELPVFEDAATFPAVVVVRKNREKIKSKFLKIESLQLLDLESLMQSGSIVLPENAYQSDNWMLTNLFETELLDKIRSAGDELGNKYQIRRGLITGFNEAFVLDEATKNKLINEDPNSADLIKRFAVGDNLRKYRLEFDNKYLILTKIGVEIDRYPAVFSHLKRYQASLEKRWDKGNYWHELRACDYYHEFESPKIVYPDIAKESRIIYDLDKTYFSNTTYFIPTSDKWLTAILNSKLVFYFYKHNSTVIGNADKGGRLRWFTQDVKRIPIATLHAETRMKLEECVDEIIELNKNHLNEISKFKQLLEENFSIQKFSKKLHNWPELEFKEFLIELKKAKVKLSLSDKAEWMLYFNEQKQKAQILKTEIIKTDREIDNLVYELYGLTDKEIETVEESLC